MKMKMLLRTTKGDRGEPSGQCRPWLAALAFVIAAACIALGSSPLRAEESAIISGVRVGVHDGVTRFVMSVSRPIRYRTFTLANPYRVVIDLPLVDWQLDEQTELGTQNIIDAFRFGAFTPTTTRVVLDVNQPVQIDRIFVLRPREDARNWRLVVDLKAISEDEFRRQARMRQERPRQNGETEETEEDRAPARRDDEERADVQPLIVIDPGHGGVDPGALSPNGTREKDVVLRVSRVIASAIEESGQFRVHLTRDGDFYIPLRQRYRIARERRADLFVSVHADSNPQRSTRGLSVYTLSERSSDAEAEALARRENRADIVAGVDLSDRSDQVAGILIDLAQRETMNESARFAETLVTAMRQRVQLLRRTHRYAGFAVLKAPDVPSVLVEVGYLTNPRDERQLRDSEYHRRIAAAMVGAITRYFAYRDRVEGRTRAQSE